MYHEALMLYKLIILYILSRIDFPISNSRIIGFLLDHEYTDYFQAQQTLGELIEDEFIVAEIVRNTTLYRITAKGNEILSMFPRSVSPLILTEIDQYLTDNRYQLRQEVSVRADYYREKNGEYIARLAILEWGSKIFDLQLVLPTEQAADRVCAGWKKKSADIYTYALEQLLSETT